ncbi:MAG: hypothetical protein LBR83_05085, partial [Clostridiales bacterium]|nr:hypothetical protein [Clostridiales bacterium]
VYALNILGYAHFREDKDALRIFELYDPKRNKRYNKELLRIGFFELPKENIETENQRHWRDYFTSGEVSAYAPEYIKKASEIIELSNLGKEELEMRTLMERAQDRYEADMYDAFYDGKDEGLAKGVNNGILIGREEGRRDQTLQIAKELKKLNLPIETIYKGTGLPLDVLEAL